MKSKLAKRLLAICLAILMVPTLAPMSIFAEEANLNQENQQEEVLPTETELVPRDVGDSEEVSVEEPEKEPVDLIQETETTNQELSKRGCGQKPGLDIIQGGGTACFLMKND
ncbi:MAG: hypothetical protein JJE03_07355 [Peptostreptococcaceae bacterium]|nr:hypothetical protein [Peptostreptococcaceae bacterium]